MDKRDAVVIKPGAITKDARVEALNNATKMSKHEVSRKVDELVAEHLKLKAMNLHKDAEVKAALATAYAEIWLRRS